MPFPHDLLTQDTWRHVGLGLATTIFALGGLAIFAPETAAEALGIIPTTSEGHAINEKSMIFLGIRDVAAAATLLWFHYEGKQKEMGVLLTSWVLVCVTDTWVATNGPKGWDKGTWTLCGGAVVVALGGLGLLQS